MRQAHSPGGVKRNFQDLDSRVRHGFGDDFLELGQGHDVDLGVTQVELLVAPGVTGNGLGGVWHGFQDGYGVAPHLLAGLLAVVVSEELRDLEQLLGDPPDEVGQGVGQVARALHDQVARGG